MNFTAIQIAGLLGGKVEGNPDTVVNKLSKIEEGSPESLAFLANPQYNHFLYTTGASIVIVGLEFLPEQPVKPTLIRVQEPRAAFAKLLATYSQAQNNQSGIEDQVHIAKTAILGEDVYVGSFAYIGEHAKIGKNVRIYPNVYIGDRVSIGDNTVLFSGVRIYADCHVGAHCTLHSGVIIGGDGFGFLPNSENNYHKMPQTGNVVIQDRVEIGSNTTIDRATLGSTLIGKGVKLDNLIQIAHNVEIGENTVIAAQCGVAGSTRIGKNCMIGGQVGIVGHLTIADGVKIAAQSGIGKSILKEGDVVQGSPAFLHSDYKRSYVGFMKLPGLSDRLAILEKEMAALKKQTEKF